ncbi:hypothetical protein [Parahaliea mediterranea]|uniref:hypothetical protein n=1 Tax=Parahaliea mediterranea TaxID=651086 RepID=UPI0013003BCE|nr:hypothetical protein [Parahaliea mediterranea]
MNDGNCDIGSGDNNLSETSSKNIKHKFEQKKWVVAAVLVPIFASSIPILYQEFVESKPLLGERYAKKVSTVFLEAIYLGDYSEAYSYASPIIKDDMPFQDFKSAAMSITSQFSQPPEFRNFESASPLNGMIMVKFRAEFDAASVFREVVTLVEDEGEYSVFRVDIQPVEWPSSFIQNNSMTWAGKYPELISLSELIAESDKNVWTPIGGWELVTTKIGEQESQRTCNVVSKSRYENNGVEVVLKGLLDGCSLQIGQALVAWGRIELVSGSQIFIANPRIQVPTEGLTSPSLPSHSSSST